MSEQLIVVGILLITLIIGIVTGRNRSKTKQRNLPASTIQQKPQPITRSSEDPLQAIRKQLAGSLDIEQFRTGSGKLDAPRLLRHIGYLTSEEWNEQLNMRSIEIECADLRECKLTGGRFRFLSGRGASFQKSELDHCAIIFSSLEGADFSESSLSHANFFNTKLVGAKFKSIYGFGLQIRQSNLLAADFSDSQLHDLVLSNCHLEQTTFVGAWMTGSYIVGECKSVDFRKTQLYSADLSNVMFIECQFEGAEYDHRTVWPVGFDPVEAGCISEQEADSRRQKEVLEWSKKAEELRQQGHRIPLQKEIRDRILEIVKLMADDTNNSVVDANGNLSQSFASMSPVESSYWTAAWIVLQDMGLEQATDPFWGPNWKETLIDQVFAVERNEVNAILQSQKQRANPIGSAEAAQQDVVSLIAKLAHLRGQGILSDEEFQRKKSELLARI